MRRRELLAVLAAQLVLAPLAARAQPKVVTVGILAIEAWPPIDSFRAALRELGYVEGKNVRFEYRYAEGRNQRFRELAEDLVANKVDLILTWGTDAALEAKRATRTTLTPIVMGAIADPIGPGVVTSLSRPGGNVTGFASLAGELEAKRLELLKEVVPNLSRVAVLSNPTNRYMAGAIKHVTKAAETAKISIRVHDAQDATTLDKTLDELARERPQAVLVLADTYLSSQRRRLAQFALKARLPSAYTYREHVEAGGLLAYTPNYHDLFRRAAGYADRIFKGIKPGDLPIEQPTKFDLVINLKTAKVLGLSIPQSVLVRADQVIE